MQINTCLQQHRCSYFVDQTLDIRRCRSAGIHDEIGMLLRHLRAADAPAFQPALLDQPCGVVAGRIAENRPGIRQVQRLALDPLSQKILGLEVVQAELGGDSVLWGALAWANSNTD